MVLVCQVNSRNIAVVTGRPSNKKKPEKSLLSETKARWFTVSK